MMFMLPQISFHYGYNVLGQNLEGGELQIEEITLKKALMFAKIP